MMHCACSHRPPRSDNHDSTDVTRIARAHCWLMLSDPPSHHRCSSSVLPPLSLALQNTRTVYGGGCSEMLMARAVDELALTVPGKEALAIEAFSRALRALPTIIADNAGYDSSELVSQLRALHYTQKDSCEMGLDMDAGTTGSMKTLRITEAYKSKMQVVVSAHDAAEMILRVDDIIRCAPRQRKGGHQH
jgi:T-complex protein 1 subunit beta